MLYTDPSGHCVPWCVVAGIGIVAAIALLIVAPHMNEIAPAVGRGVVDVIDACDSLVDQFFRTVGKPYVIPLPQNKPTVIPGPIYYNPTPEPTKSKYSIALGMWEAISNGRFATRHNALWYDQWPGAGVVPSNINMNNKASFLSTFPSVANEAEHIYFAVNGVYVPLTETYPDETFVGNPIDLLKYNKSAAMLDGAKGISAARLANVELYMIMNNPDRKRKTTFHFIDYTTSPYGTTDMLVPDFCERVIF